MKENQDFFDGKCAICSREINYYRSLAPKDNFIWCDLHSNSNMMKEYQLDYKQALLTLHAVDENGILHIGVDAFTLIWKNIPRLSDYDMVIWLDGTIEITKDYVFNIMFLLGKPQYGSISLKDHIEQIARCSQFLNNLHFKP